MPEFTFDWDDKYSVGVKEIDDQHKELVANISKLADCINQAKMKEEGKVILDALLHYAQYHFDTEEKYFSEFNYEGSEKHINAHRAFKNKMLDLKTKFENNEIEITFELIDFLEDWLLDHLMDMDQGYVKCFSEHGLK